MPCRTETPEEEEQRRRDELDKLTRLLCESCQCLEDSMMAAEQGVDFFTDELRQWWEDHKKADEARKRREEVADAKRLTTLSRVVPSLWSEEEATFVQKLAADRLKALGVEGRA